MIASLLLGLVLVPTSFFIYIDDNANAYNQL